MKWQWNCFWLGCTPENQVSDKFKIAGNSFRSSCEIFVFHGKIRPLLLSGKVDDWNYNYSLTERCQEGNDISLWGKMIHQIQKYQLQQQQLWESGSAYAFFLLQCYTAAPAICTFHFSTTPGGLGCCISAFAFCMLHFAITFGGPGYCVSVGWQKFGSEWSSHSSFFLHLKWFSLEMTFFPLVLA